MIHVELKDWQVWGKKNAVPSLLLDHVMKECYSAYTRLLALGIAPTQAGVILLQAVQTMIEFLDLVEDEQKP